MNPTPSRKRKSFLQFSRFITRLILVAVVFTAKSVDLSTDGVTNLAGDPVQLKLEERQVPAVLIFLSTDCPISNRYAPTIRKLQSEFRKVRWVLVYPNRDESAEKIQKNLKEFELSCEAWRDTKHILVNSAEVSITPEVTVFVPSVGFIYRGRIDDRYVDFGRKRTAATTNDLRKILVQIENGKVPSRTITKAVGCHIPKLKN